MTFKNLRISFIPSAIIGSLAIGATFFLSPVSGILIDKLGIRTTTMLGGLIASTGMFLSSLFVHTKNEPFNPENVTTLCITYGLMFGTGAALAYTPSLAILGHYFKRNLGIVNGIVNAGSPVFTAFLPEILKYIEKNYGLRRCIQVMTVMSGFVILLGLCFKPLKPRQPSKKKHEKSKCYNFTRSIINFDNWKKKKYVIWALCVPVALFGYFVPYVHIRKFAMEKFPSSSDTLPLTSIVVASSIGRVVSGKLSDLPQVNSILMQQVAFYFIGLTTMCLPFTDSYFLLLVLCFVLGFSDGCFVALIGPIAFGICGPHGAAQAIGFLLGLCSFGLTAGPPIAGLIYDMTSSYNLPFLIAGIPPILGATIMFMIRFVREDKKGENDPEEMLGKVNSDD